MQAHAPGVAVDQALTGARPLHLADEDVAARRLQLRVQDAFEGHGRFDDARRRHGPRGQGVKAGLGELAAVCRKRLAADVHLRRHGLVAQVHGELPGQAVRGRVLKATALGAVNAFQHARRVFAKHVEQRERRRIGHARRPQGRTQRDGPGHDHA